MENVTEIKRIRQTIQTLLKEEYAFVKDTIDLIEIKTDGDMKNAGDFRIKVNKFCKMLEDKRKTEVDPFNKLVKDINAEFKQATSLFDNELSRLDDKIKPFLIEVARKKEEAARAARESELAEMARKKEEALKNAIETEQEVFVDIAGNIETEQQELKKQEIVVHKSVKSEDTSTSLIDNWKARIANADLVPRMYCMPDEKVLNKLAKARVDEIKAGTLKVPGVEFWNDSYLGSRAR